MSEISEDAVTSPPDRSRVTLYAWTLLISVAAMYAALAYFVYVASDALF